MHEFVRGFCISVEKLIAFITFTTNVGKLQRILTDRRSDKTLNNSLRSIEDQPNRNTLHDRVIYTIVARVQIQMSGFDR